MNRFISIVIASFCISGCASTVKSVSSNDTLTSSKKAYRNYEDCLMRTGDESIHCTKEKDQLLASLKKDYEDCLMRKGEDPAQCIKEKDRLLGWSNRNNWKDEVEEYGS